MKKLLKYLNESPTVFFILKKIKGDWQLEYVTENVIQIYGKTADEFLSKKYFHEDFIHKVDLIRFKEEASLISKLKTNEYTYKPYRIVNDNTITWVSHTTKIFRDQTGKQTYYYGYLTDITKEQELYNELNFKTDVLDSIFNNSFNLILLLDKHGKLIKANRTSLEIAGLEEKKVLGKYFWELPWWNHYNTTEIQQLIEEIKLVQKGTCLKNHKHYFNTTYQKIEVDFCFSPVFDEQNNINYILCEGHDITQSINTKKKLDQYMNIVNENVFISISDLSGKIIDISEAYCRFTGYSKYELLGKNHNIFKHPDNDDYIFRQLWDTITSGKIWKGEHKNIKKDGSIYWVENSITPNYDENKRIRGYTSIYNDITDKKEISQLLITDYLTKVYNRRHFNTVFDIELKRAKRDKENFILLLIDIDYFKQYNDTYGHDEGDKALLSVANALKYSLNRATDFVFRLGGEEFGIITSRIDNDGALSLAKKLNKSIENLNIKHIGNSISDFMTISIGIKVVSYDSKLRKNDIYKLTDKALYKAKDLGRNRSIISEE
jgi:diguanylate cyclase (GGDEF)-like protein/PAS domain S-box-containing protein